ncbi:MAG: hypothetical protein R3258_08595, partial [Acidimicrobiia bacterium]|nr:hypothetical protein [Acidimicrobiia bacterium]
RSKIYTSARGAVLADQVIYDRGYRPYDGPRTGAAGARRAVYKDGLRRVLGLGRKARYKVFPWILIAIAVVAAAGFIGVHWAGREFVGGAVVDLLPAYGELFDFYSRISLLFIAFAGPVLLIPDRTEGVLSVYFSRPLTINGYIAAKWAAFATLVGGIYLVPQILLHLGLALLSDRGFAGYMAQTSEVLWKVPVTTLGFVAMHGALVFALSAFINRTGFAAAAFFGVVVAGTPVAGRVSEATFSGAKWFALTDPDQHPRIIRDFLFNDTVRYPAEVAGFEPWVSALIIVITVVSAAVLVRARYRRLA